MTGVFGRVKYESIETDLSLIHSIVFPEKRVFVIFRAIIEILESDWIWQDQIRFPVVFLVGCSMIPIKDISKLNTPLLFPEKLSFVSIRPIIEIFVHQFLQLQFLCVFWLQVIICVRLNAIEIPALPNHCTYKHDTHKAPMTLNSSEPIGTYENIHIPFPEIGIWYFSIGLFNLSKYQDLSNTDRIRFNCAHLNESCKQFCRPTDRTCLSYCSEDVCEGTPQKLASNETQETKSGDGGKLMRDWLDQNVTDLKAGMVFSLAMSACLDEKCANGGACRIQSDNSLLFSYCYCHNDYQGKFDSYKYTQRYIVNFIFLQDGIAVMIQMWQPTSWPSSMCFS